MPRKARAAMETTYFHVLVQGINKTYIFENEMDIKMYIKWIYQEHTDFYIDIIAYCIMNNHAHLLLNVEKIENLSKYMHKVNTKYAGYYNKKYDRVGYVFRDRFKTQGIYSERQLHCCKAYIFNNPIKAGICKDVSEYAFSNYNPLKHDITLVSDSEFNFIELEEDKKKEYKRLINTFMKINKFKNMVDLKSDKAKLRKLVIILIERYGVSIRKISQIIKIDRKKLKEILENDLNSN